MAEKTVYFLGAGATKSVCENAPLNRDLVKKALNDFSDSAEAKHIMEFIKNLFHGRLNSPIDNQIWNLLDYIAQKGKSASVMYNLENILELRRDLLSLIIREIDKSLTDVDMDTCRKFVKTIDNPQSTIISTNYDILIDNALYAETQYNYGIKIRSILTGEYGEEEGLNRPMHLALGKSVNKGGIPLLKSHGSLNWLYCPKCDEVDITIGEKGAVKTLKGLYCVNKNCTNKYESLLIAPTMFKNYENRVIKETWEMAENKLIEADILMFIGYALKEEDYHIRCLLMKALLNKEKNYEKITVVEMDPKDNPKDKKAIENVEKNFKELYGEIDFRPIGFVKYVDSLKK